MIKFEYLNDGALIRHYSDSGYMLLQVETGLKYSDPVDLVPCRYTYAETDEIVELADENLKEGTSEEAAIADYQEALSEFGVKV